MISTSCGKHESQTVQPPDQPPIESPVESPVKTPDPVTAEPGVGAVTLRWAAVPGATSYNVQFSISAALDTFTSVEVVPSKTSLTIGNLKGGETYYFAVTATSGDRTSARTTPVSEIPIVISKVLGGDHVDDGACATTDASGNVLLGGSTTSHPFEAVYGSGGTSAFVTKRTPSGERMWTRLLGKGNTHALAIATGPADEVYLAGYTVDDLDGTHTGWSDYFIAKFDAAGNLAWVRQMGVAGANTQAKGIAVDGDGSAYLAGVTFGDLAGITRNGNSDLFVTKYDRSGNRKWIRLFGDSGSLVEGKAIAATSSGFVVTGKTSGWFYGERGSISPVFVMRCDADGNRIWSHAFGAGLTTEVASVAVNPEGNIYLAGYSDGNIKSIPKIGEYDTFLCKFSAGGDFQWMRTSGSSGRYKKATGMVVSSSGGVFVVGTVTNSQGYQNLFLESFSVDGEKVWSVVRGTENPLNVAGLAVFTDRIYVVGSTSYSGTFEANQSLGYNDVFLAGFNSEYGCY